MYNKQSQREQQKQAKLEPVRRSTVCSCMLQRVQCCPQSILWRQTRRENQIFFTFLYVHSKTKLILGVFLNRPVPQLWAASRKGDTGES